MLSTMHVLEIKERGLANASTTIRETQLALLPDYHPVRLIGALHPYPAVLSPSSRNPPGSGPLIPPILQPGALPFFSIEIIPSPVTPGPSSRPKLKRPTQSRGSKSGLTLKVLLGTIGL